VKTKRCRWPAIHCCHKKRSRLLTAELIYSGATARKISYMAEDSRRRKRRAVRGAETNPVASLRRDRRAVRRTRRIVKSDSVSSPRAQMSKVGFDVRDSRKHVSMDSFVVLLKRHRHQGGEMTYRINTVITICAIQWLLLPY
jgi:hypothetical protein